MASVALLLANQFSDGAGVIKNGLSGAPAINEDAENPLANLTTRARYRFWRCNTTPGTPLQIDRDFIGSVTIRRVGVAMVRAYRGANGFATVNVYSGTGSIYPPSYTLRSSFAVNPATDNDVFADLGANITARFWRFEFGTVVGQFSLKPWLVGSSDLVTLNEGIAGATENPKRVREREKKTFLGGALFNDLGIGVAQVIREFRVPMIVTQTQLTAIRTSQKGNLIYQHYDGKYYAVRHLEPTLVTKQLSGVGVRYQTTITLVQVP